MSEADNPFPLAHEARGGWVRLRTLILLRWMAILGQLIALEVAQRLYNLQLELGLCYFALGLSVIANLVAMFVFPQNKRLSEVENFLMFLFDLLQLSFLLYLTGGLHNPFAVLILGPVTLSAAALSTRSTILLAAAAILLVTALAEYHLTLQTEMGFVLRVPDVFVFGHWVALVIAIVFLSINARRITAELHSMQDALTATNMALAREQKLTDLGGVVAAAAHELGTPLATIKLTSSELAEELQTQPELLEDALLIREQADRCRDILQGMGRAGKSDPHLRQAPLMAVLREAAEPHQSRGIEVLFSEHPARPGLPQPSVLRRPEIIHGLRNLFQNAVDFAHSRVWVDASWSEDEIRLRIMDNGPGFPPAILGRIGDPFVRHRAPDTERARPEYQGMGLGLFISKTLLERTGAELSFANGSDPFLSLPEQGEQSGAVVEVIWPRHSIDAATATHDSVALNTH
ncbi:two-component system, sensor histidine kinase RegB [Poseidonocella pacifica]|uniref:histidine kinase n=1 Tax=Poseidonocella pacifica TaxID=871651 RepID=A0A1I0XTW4_9RHOB|nr:ActS/PrrB/RegB family redox-sensitive histidine kinase [Poseidonocella pacifica]SFB04515.1 two-component system, sensor histidine kinase RegB [Poseidonocella pacifica]